MWKGILERRIWSHKRREFWIHQSSIFQTRSKNRLFLWAKNVYRPMTLSQDNIFSVATHGCIVELHLLSPCFHGYLCVICFVSPASVPLGFYFSSAAMETCSSLIYRSSTSHFSQNTDSPPFTVNESEKKMCSDAIESISLSVGGHGRLNYPD